MNVSSPLDPDAQFEMAEILADAARAAADDPKAIAEAAQAFDRVMETIAGDSEPTELFEVLQVDPGCADCLVVVASGFTDSDAARTVLEAAVEVAERRLGVGRSIPADALWYDSGGRTFLRALLQLAEARFTGGDYNAGVEAYERLLELNPGDNQGVRYILAGGYLTLDRVEKARELLERYPDEVSATWTWARALLEFLDRDFDAAARTVAQARKQNPYVEDLIAGAEDLPEELPDSYEMGSPEEAVVVADLLAFAWRLRPLAIAWLRVGGRPGDDVYFGGYSDAGFDELLNGMDEDDDEPDDEGNDGGGPSGGRGYMVQ